MIPPPLPADEVRRLAALHSLGILDSQPEARFDRITRIASALFDVPMAVVSLVDTNRQWFKSCIGIDDAETDRSVSFCGHAILRPDEIMVVPDAWTDPRFADNPLVTGDPYIRFYAGRPLLAGGLPVGTLCIIDSKARDFTERDRSLLADLGQWAQQELATIEVENAAAALNALLESMAEGVVTFNADGNVLSMNPAGEAMFGRSEIDVLERPITDLVVPKHRELVASLLAERLAKDAGELVQVEIEGLRGDGRPFPIEVSASELHGSDATVFIAVARDQSEVSALRRRYQVILEAAGDGVIGVDLEGRITFANPAAEALMAAPAGGLVGRKLHTEMHHTRPDGSPYPWTECPTYRTMAENRPVRIDSEVFFRLDGTPFGVEYATTPIVDGGHVVGAVLVFTDISIRHEVERLRRQEMENAATIQLGLLPNRPPDVPGVRVEGRYLAAKDVGGDLFDHLVDEEGRLSVVVADVAGHGVASALLMATTRGALRRELRDGRSPKAVLEAAAEAVHDDLAGAGLFVTVFCAQIDLGQRCLRFANGAHNPALLRRVDGAVVELDADGMAFGFARGWPYDEGACPLEPGDLLVLYTDGITEARDEHGDLFGEDRLVKLVAGLDAEGAADSIVAAVVEHAGELRQDDLTVLTVAIL